MVTGEAESFVLFVHEDPQYSFSPCCRICHEAEAEDKSLESPCACSGTAKFAHRDCIQRWCDQKGNTTCEICLQNYEPGYTARPIPKKLRLIEEEEAGAAIRDSSLQPAVSGFPTDADEEDEEGYSHCTTAADCAMSFCRSFALTLTVFLLLRHAIDVLVHTPEHYPFTILTVLVLRMSGIALPMFLVFRTITSVQNRIRRRYLVVEEESDRRLQHIV